MAQPVIFWFRQDLRLSDNPSLQAALAHCRNEGAPLIPVFIDDEHLGRRPGRMSLWWRDAALAALDAALRQRGSRLLYLTGKTAPSLTRLIDSAKAGAVYWNRQYDAPSVEHDTALKADLRARGLFAESRNALLMFEPWEIKGKTSNGPMRVFTPFWKRCREIGLPEELSPAPDTIPTPDIWPESAPLPQTPPHEAADLLAQWMPGETGAALALDNFLHSNGHGYAEKRDLPAINATSRLSPHLRWGDISPQRIAHEASGSRLSPLDKDKFLAELGWREFAYHLMFHNPEIGDAPLQRKFEAFPWRDDDAVEQDLQDWQNGRTGYPIVDAGMRELKRSGYMHNRVRMICASFLVKHLLIDWRHGEAWFWDRLNDADPANNTASWQWVAGCGADAAPYFRIFNPITQGSKFDAEGVYTKAYVPELAGLSGKTLFAPWEAKQDLLAKAEVEIGATYPAPIVDHKQARERALESFGSLSSS